MSNLNQMKVQGVTYDIEAKSVNSDNAVSGQILTADGQGGSQWITPEQKLPVIDTETDMDNLLRAENIGKYYYYAGPTILGKFSQNQIYKIIVDSKTCKLLFEGHRDYEPLNSCVTYGEGMYGNIYYCCMPQVSGASDVNYISSTRCQFYAVDENNNEIFLGEECVY